MNFTISVDINSLVPGVHQYVMKNLSRNLQQKTACLLSASLPDSLINQA